VGEQHAAREAPAHISPRMRRGLCGVLCPHEWPELGSVSHVVVGEEDMKPSETLASKRARNARVFGSVLRAHATRGTRCDSQSDQ
jgi:hypothetical protein